MVAIEDCLTLEVLVVSVDELRVADLTAVVPSRQTAADAGPLGTQPGRKS